MIGERAGDRPINPLDIAYQRIVEDGGGKYVSHWKLGDETYVLFNSPFSGSTLALKEPDLTAENVKSHIHKSDVKFGKFFVPMQDTFLAELRRLVSLQPPLPSKFERQIWEPTRSQLHHWVHAVIEKFRKHNVER